MSARPLPEGLTREEIEEAKKKREKPDFPEVLKEERERLADKTRRERPQRGEPDVEPAIDTSHLDTMEREQRREIIASVSPIESSPSGQLSRTLPVSRARRELGERAEEIEATVREQDAIFNQNVEAAYDTLEAVKDRGPNEPAVIVETAEGPVEMTKGEYRRFVDNYISRYQEWRGKAVEVSGRLIETKEEIFEQVGRWARNVRERNEAVDEQKADFNQELLNITAEATERAEEPDSFNNRLLTIDTPRGPGAPPLPGTFGARLQATGTRVLSTLEAPFVAATTPIRARGERLRGEAGEEPPSFGGLFKFLEGATLATGAAAFDAATIGVRPGLVVKAATSGASLALSGEARGELVETVRRDPFTFTAEIAGTIGGAALGSKLANIGRTLVTERGPIFRAARAEFQVSGIRGVPRTIRAVAERGTARLDFNQLLKEEIALYEFPSEFVIAEPFEFYTKFKAREIKPEFQRLIDPFDFRLDTPLGEFTKIGRGGTLVRTGAGIMEVPIQVPEQMTVPTTLLRKTVFSLVEPSGRPAIPIEIPSLTALTRPGLNLGGILAGLTIPKQRQIPRITTTQIQRPGTVQQNLQRFNQELVNRTRNIQAPPGGNQAVITAPIQVQRPRPTQIQKIDVPQIQIPRIPTPTEPQPPDEPFPFFVPPPPTTRTTRTVLEFDPRKKKKKDKPARRVKKVVEKRTDPLGVISWDPRKKKR